MKIFYLFIFSISVFSNAQVHRYYYKYSFQSDSTYSGSKREELMVLDVDKAGSKYYSEYIYESDSTMQEIYKNMDALLAAGKSISLVNKKDGTVRDKVFKTYPDFTTTYFTQIDFKDYEVKEDRKLQWKILSEKSKIGIWQAQKATTSFAGRKCTAWFSMDIPIQDGPYKFYGLPGLIVKIEDASGTQKIELVAVKNNPLVRKDVTFFDSKPTKADYKKLKTIYKAYWNDPMAYFRNQISQGEIHYIDDAGNQIDATQRLKEQDKTARENLLRNSNILEIDLIPKL